MTCRRSCRAAYVALAACALSGCATGPATPSAAAAPRTLAASFELEGRLSATDGSRAGNGGVRWVHAPETDEWTVTSPLGQIVGQLVSTPRGASLLTADGRVEKSERAGDLLQRLLGVAAPLDGLPAWVQAVPREQARVLALDAVGRPSRITDAGWIVEYPEYAGPSPGAAPRRVDAHWGETRIRLVIDQWTPL